MATAQPSPSAQPSFLLAVRGFCKLLYQIGSPEVRVATFVFEHTVCYMEFDTSKRITLDEFVNGRKKRDGSRFTEGCNISKRNNVSRALKHLENQGVLTIDTDERDKGRQRKFYRLTLPSLDTVIETDNTPLQETVILPTTVIHPDNRPVIQTDNTNAATVIHSDNPEVSIPITQSYPNGELDQSKYLQKVPEERDTSLSAVSAAQGSLFPVIPIDKQETKPLPAVGSKKKRSKTEQLLERRPELRPLHDMAVTLFGKPMGLTALNWADHLEELGDRPVTAEQLAKASAWYRREHPTWNHSLRAITNHYHEYEQSCKKEGTYGTPQSSDRNHPTQPDKSANRFILNRRSATA